MSNKIDLHGIKHEDVQRKLDIFLWETINSNHTEAEVVTGISNRMKDIVKEISKDYNFKVEEFTLNPGVLIIYLK
jgi:DNA-nicking Smr family endonuclease